MTKKKNLSHLDTYLLWIKAAGRCEFNGCNKILYQDPNTWKTIDLAERAHIIARSPNGPRGDKEQSASNIDKIDNIMLLCRDCHKIIDTNPEDFPIEALLKMKENHENRIKIVTEFNNDNMSHIVTYFANIGDMCTPINAKLLASTIFKNQRIPADFREIDLSNRSNALRDHQPEFWAVEEKNLTNMFNRKLLDRISEIGDVKHISLFAMAPVPLLIKLGTLFTDKCSMDIYQRSREPDTWDWGIGDATIDLKIIPPSSNNDIIALNLSLSADISDEDIKQTLGDNLSIWKVTLNNPNYDCIKTPGDLSKFRSVMREIYNKIKKIHTSNKIINLFAAVPVSAAIEIGRTWMPRADLPIQTYNRLKDSLEFKKAILIGKED